MKKLICYLVLFFPYLLNAQIQAPASLPTILRCANEVSRPAMFHISAIGADSLIVNAPAGFELAFSPDGLYKNYAGMLKNGTAPLSADIYIRVKADAPSDALGNIFCSTSHSSPSSQIAVTSAISTPSAPSIYVSSTSYCQGDLIVATMNLGANNTFSSSSGPKRTNIGGTGFQGGFVEWGNAVSSGFFILTAQNELGCKRSTFKLITVKPQPTIAAITGNLHPCVGTITTLSSTPGGTWSSSNTAVATITSSGQVKGVSAGTSTINYTATATNGCSRTVTSALTVGGANCSSLRTEELTEESPVAQEEGTQLAYPNPALNGKIFLKEPASYSLLNSAGIPMKQGYGNEILLDDLTKGIYLLKANDKVQKIMIQ